MKVDFTLTANCRESNPMTTRLKFDTGKMQNQRANVLVATFLVILFAGATVYLAILIFTTP